VSPETLSEAIFGAKISNLASKVRFWNDLGFSRGPKIDLWRIIFYEKGEKKEGDPTRGGVLEPTWARLGAENGPKKHFYRSGVVLGRFWKDFGPVWGDFSTILVDF